MAMLKFRNSRGMVIDVPTITADHVEREFGVVLERAMREGVVTITCHGKPEAVPLSYEEFESLVQTRSRTLDKGRAASDELLDRMQTAKAKRGMVAAFHASPNKLGRAAVKSARKVH